MEFLTDHLVLPLETNLRTDKDLVILIFVILEPSTHSSQILRMTHLALDQPYQSRKDYNLLDQKASQNSTTCGFQTFRLEDFHPKIRQKSYRILN